MSENKKDCSPDRYPVDRYPVAAAEGTADEPHVEDEIKLPQAGSAKRVVSLRIPAREKVVLVYDAGATELFHSTLRTGTPRQLWEFLRADSKRRIYEQGALAVAIGACYNDFYEALCLDSGFSKTRVTGPDADGILSVEHQAKLKTAWSVDDIKWTGWQHDAVYSAL